jgi:glycosyltransferase involved in cell wall biosynthesis
MLLAQDTPAFREAVPTKLYEYLASGMAVLATPLPRVVPFVDGAGAGALVGDADDAARQLRAWANDPVALVSARRAALAWAEENLGGVSPWNELAARIAVLARPSGSRARGPRTA